MVQIRRLTDPTDPAIAAFGVLQARTYAQPEHLIPPAYLPWLLRQQNREQQNFMLVAEHEGVIIGGSVFHLLRAPNTGFSSFMTVAPEWRGRSLSRRLHEARMQLLDAEVGAAVEGLFIETVAPGRLSAQELALERAVGSDPLLRRGIFARLGFYQVGIRYEQPVGGPEGGPVTNLDLLFYPREPRRYLPSLLVIDTMRAYWTSWLGQEQAERHAQALKRRAPSSKLTLLPLTLTPPT